MPIPLASQFRGQNTSTWCGLSTHPLLDFSKKAQSRIIWIGPGAAPLVACSGPSLVSLTISPHDEGSPSNPFYNYASAFISQETSKNGSLSTYLGEDTAFSSREESAKEVVEKKTAQEPYTSLDRGFVKTNEAVKDCLGLEVQENASRKHEIHLNKGKIPWNKGRQHSEETKQRIRERTREAMEDPKLRERLRIKAKGSPLSSETKLKIRTAIMNLWDAKRKVQKRQESCVVEWNEMIAGAARRGSDGDVVYQWDSYNTIWGELRDTWKALQRQSTMVGNKSADHRMKISEAIRAKWADPNYRKSVHNGLHAYLLNRGAQPTERGSRRASRTANVNKQSGIFLLDGDDIDSLAMSNQKSSVIKYNPAKKALRAYKDPLTQDKLEKLKRVRASRLSVEEMKRKNMTERARVLLAEAKRAANALEAAAAKDKNAIAPLLETRRLLAEAARSFETAGLGSCGHNAALLEGEGFEETQHNDSPSTGAGSETNNAALLEGEGFEETQHNDSPSTGAGSETKNSQHEVSSRSVVPPSSDEDLPLKESHHGVSSTRAGCYLSSTVVVRSFMEHYVRSQNQSPFYTGNVRLRFGSCRRWVM